MSRAHILKPGADESNTDEDSQLTSQWASSEEYYKSDAFKSAIESFIWKSGPAAAAVKQFTKFWHTATTMGLHCSQEYPGWYYQCYDHIAGQQPRYFSAEEGMTALKQCNRIHMNAKIKQEFNCAFDASDITERLDRIISAMETTAAVAIFQGKSFIIIKRAGNYVLFDSHTHGSLLVLSCQCKQPSGVVQTILKNHKRSWFSIHSRVGLMQKLYMEWCSYLNAISS